MRGWRGVLSGVLGLIALQVVVSTSGASGRVSSGMGDVASLLRRALSPAVPLIPDLRSAGAQPSLAQPALAQPALARTPPPAGGAASPQAEYQLVSSLPRLAPRPSPVPSVISA